MLILLFFFAEHKSSFFLMNELVSLVIIQDFAKINVNKRFFILKKSCFLRVHVQVFLKLLLLLLLLLFFATTLLD